MVALFSSLLAGPFAAPSLAYPASLLPSSGAYFGARVEPRGSESTVQALQRAETQIGRKYNIDHQYYLWNHAIPTAHQEWDVDTGRIPFINWNALRSDGSIVRWSAIANGSQDTWITARADAFRAFRSPIYLTFHHEPEDDLSRFGSPGDFAAAFRRIVSIFRNRGVTNVAFVWTMMAWSFDPRSDRDANAYYPGDSYVDFVGVDGYNWYPRRPGDPWRSFQEIFQLSNNFAVSHGKPWVIVEFGALEDPQVSGRKGQWFRDTIAAAKRWPQLKALIYFNVNKGAYPWIYDSSTTSLQGFAALGRDPYFNPGSTPPPPPPPPTPPPPTPDTTLSNSLDLGPQGAAIQPGQRAPVVDPFSVVMTSAGSTLTYDGTHALGRYSAKHVLTSRGNAYYQWTGDRTLWFGRIYVWLNQLPPSNIRLIRGSTNNVLRCAIDIQPNGTLRFLDQGNRVAVATTSSISTGRWVRIEWKVDHAMGLVKVGIFNNATSMTPTQVVTSPTRRAIGPSVREIQYGRSGTQPFAFTFWTDGPAVSSTWYLGTS